MATIMTKVYTVQNSNGTYRFSDLCDKGTHYTARQVLDDNRLGRMRHRISKTEFEQASITVEELRTKQP